MIRYRNCKKKKLAANRKLIMNWLIYGYKQKLYESYGYKQKLYDRINCPSAVNIFFLEFCPSAENIFFLELATALPVCKGLLEFSLQHDLFAPKPAYNTHLELDSIVPTSNVFQRSSVPVNIANSFSSIAPFFSFFNRR